MSRYQPTLREAREQVASMERMLASAVDTRPVAGGFDLRFKRQRYLITALWPVSSIENRCDDCGCVLRGSRDAGGQGFFYDKRWLIGDPSKRDPRLSHGYEPHFACLPCFNRARGAIRAAEAVNENRLNINRIRKELYHATQDGR